MIHFVGLDVSMAKIGVCVLSEDVQSSALYNTKFKDPDMNTFHAEPTMPKIDRIVQNVDRVFGILGSIQKGKLGYVAVEEPTYGNPQFCGYDIGMAYGIVMEHLLRKRLNYIIVNVSKVKSFVSSKKVEGKNEVKVWCETQGVRFPDGKVSKEYIYDMADAYVLARIAHMFFKLQGKLFLPGVLSTNHYKVFCGTPKATAEGRPTGLLERPDLFRVFSQDPT